MFDVMRGDGLRARAMRGSSWTLVGFGAQQVLRLASNLILTRLLFPEAFGLMALAQVFLQGLNMLSDIGVGPSIVQNERGDDPDFLATAWTMQVIRGFTLFGAMCLLAYPASLVYDEPLLFPVLVLIGTTAIFSGFQSIGLATANRKMLLGRLAVLDLVTQMVGIATMVIWAWLHPTVWALVGGGVASSLVRVLLGHRVFRSAGNRFHFERLAAHNIFQFGKWIFFATAFTYLSGKGLVLVQGMLVPTDTLGKIAIAGTLALLARQLTQKVGSSVLFPAFSEVHRNRPHRILERLKEVRLKLFIGTLPIYLVLILFGREIIQFLYDPRYDEAGVFLVVLATAGAITTQRTPFGMTLLAVGDSYGHALIKFATTFVNITALIAGFALYGVVGMLVGGVVSQLIVYPIEAWRLRKNGLWLPMIDLLVISIYLVVGSFSLFSR